MIGGTETPNAIKEGVTPVSTEVRDRGLVRGRIQIFVPVRDAWQGRKETRPAHIKAGARPQVAQEAVAPGIRILRGQVAVERCKRQPRAVRAEGTGAGGSQPKAGR